MGAASVYGVCVALPDCHDGESSGQREGGMQTYCGSVDRPIAPIRAQRIPITYGILYGWFNTRRYTSVHGFYFFKLFPIGCVGINLDI